MHQTSSKGKVILYNSFGNFEYKLHLLQTSKNYVFTFKWNIIESRMHRKNNHLNWI